MNKLNVGCGLDYRKDFVNTDFNKGVYADVYWDLEKESPFPTNHFEYILLDNVLEHIYPQRLIGLIEELHRISKPNGIIEIYTPHASGMYAFSHLTHYSFFGIGKFDSFKIEEQFNGERYSKVKFKVKEELLFFHHNLIRFKFLSKLSINFLFNFGKVWKQLMEKFFVFGFDEIKYELEVIKNRKKK